MEIKHKETDERGEFYIEEKGEKLGRLFYHWAGTDRIIIEHTEVSEALKGKGAGKQLVMKAVEMARDKNIKIVPLCPFANKIMHLKDDFKDVL